MTASSGKRVLLTFFMFDVSKVLFPFAPLHLFKNNQDDLFSTLIMQGMGILIQMLLLNTTLTTHQLYPLKMENSIWDLNALPSLEYED